MIQHIKIENYKSIPSLELDLGRVNVLVGENGCGKTNILEAVALGSAATENKLDSDVLMSRGIRVGVDKSFKSGFSNQYLAQPIIIDFQGDEFQHLRFLLDYQGENLSITEASGKLIDEATKALESLYPSKPTSSDSKKELVDVLGRLAVTVAIGMLLTKAMDMLEPKSSLSPFLLFTPEYYHLRRFEEEGQIRPLGIRGEGLFSHLADLTRKDPVVFQKINETLQLIDWFEGFEIPNDLVFNERRIRIRDRYLDEGIQYIDQRSSNEGFLYLLFYVTLFVSPYTPKFFAIDNIDNALNPRLCAKLVEVLVRLAKENDKQVLLTAHNPGLLDGLNLTDDEQRLFVISRNKVGHTKALRIEQKPSANGHEPVRLSEQFLRGYIGGLPNI